MFSWLNSAQEAIETARTQFFYDLDDSGTAAKEEGTTAGGGANLWELIAGRGRGWSVLLEMLSQEENFYVVNHNAVLSSPLLEPLEVQEAVQSSSRSVFDEGQIGVPEVFMQQSTNLPSVRSMHFSVMPRLVSDEMFWKNLYWRLLSLSKIHDLPTAVSLACILVHEPKAAPIGGPRHRNVGVENTAFQQQLKDEIERVLSEGKWVEGKINEASEVIQNAEGCLATLKGLRSRVEQSDLVSSLVESCTFHKTKVGSLLGDLAACPVESLVGTELSPLEECGTFYRSLVNMNEQLKDALAPKEVNEQPSLPEAVSTAPAVAEVHDLVPLSDEDEDFIVPDESDEFENVSTPSPTTQASGKLPSDTAQVNEDEFNAKLPWDDD